MKSSASGGADCFCALSLLAIHAGRRSREGASSSMLRPASVIALNQTVFRVCQSSAGRVMSVTMPAAGAVT
jgi:hypothetical protein